MKLGPPRLLPIVIAATAALLLFKGVGIVTQGGYSLVGTAPAIAAGGGGGGSAKAEGGGEHAASGGEGGGNDMVDHSPTLEDTSVTMELSPADAEGGGHGEKPAAGEHGAETPEVGPADTPVAEACPPVDGAAAPAEGHGAPAESADAGGHGSESAAPAEGHGAPAEGAATETVIDPCAPDPGVNEYGDALPLVKDNASGRLVPLADITEESSSEAAINERLSERRSELDAREKELDMRSTLLDAAEKRIEERSAELKAMEERIAKLVDDNKTAEQQQFVSLVAMYENMKPKDAATIFDQLDLPVLLGVAKAMNPMKAKALTDGIAADEAPADAGVVPGASAELGNLPQIVGN